MRVKIILAAVIVTIAVFGFVVAVPAIVATVPAPAIWGYCISSKCNWSTPNGITSHQSMNICRYQQIASGLNFRTICSGGYAPNGLKNIANWGTCHATKCTW